MKSPRSNAKHGRPRLGPNLPRKASTRAKLLNLPEDDLSEIVAKLMAGATYDEICRHVKLHHRITCSRMAVQSVWRKFASREQEMRDDRIIRRARLILQSPQQQ